MPTSPINEVIQYLRSTLVPEGADLTDGQLLECFVSRRDPAALEALVCRHGPMVWGVCRRILQSHHDAEDAFQATFLVLVRKAASIRSGAKVGNWLYGVAHQTALKARAARAKRKSRETQVTDMPEPAVAERDAWSDLQAVLDEELSRLPEKYRTVIVLCDLEGKTGKEAAGHLGLPQGTVASRLARARVMLAKRLARHRLAVSGGTLAAVLSEKAASASVPSTVMNSTIKAVTLVAAGQAAATLVSAKVAALTEEVMKGMLLTKLKLALAVAVVLVVTGLGIGRVVLQTRAADPPEERAANEKPAATKVAAAEREDRPDPARRLATQDTQQALAAGLAYLAKEQAADGSWGTRQYKGSVAITSLAGLAFLSRGQRPDAGNANRVVRKAVGYVLNQEHPGVPGLFCEQNPVSGPMYNQGFALLFLAEAHAVTRDKRQRTEIEGALQRGVKLLLRTQNDQGGWRYQPKKLDADLSITACQAAALRAARDEGIGVPRETLDRAVAFLERCQTGDGGFSYQPGSGASGFLRTGAAVTALDRLGVRDRGAIDKGLVYLHKVDRKADRSLRMYFTYGHYWAAQAMWHAGGKRWDAWYRAVRDELLAARTDDGQWVDTLPSCPHLSTSLALIVLEMSHSRLRSLSRTRVDNKGESPIHAPDTGLQAEQQPTVPRMPGPTAKKELPRMGGGEQTTEEKSLDQSVAEAQVIVVGTALDAGVWRGWRPGDSPESLIRFRVQRVLKGAIKAKEMTIRTPDAPEEYLKKDWVLILSPEFMAGMHQFADCNWIKAEAEIRDILRRQATEPARRPAQPAGEPSAADAKQEKPAVPDAADKADNPVGQVDGTVTFNGNPLSGGTLAYHPANGKAVMVVLRPDGNYAIAKLPAGQYRVTVETESLKPHDKDKGKAKGDAAPKADAEADARYVPIPQLFADAKTTPLSVAVVAGKQTFDFNLHQ